MKCSKCQSENTGSGRFCRACGAPLAAAVASPAAATCPACGAEVRPGSKFCGSCAAPLVATAPTPRPAGEVCAACGAELIPGMRFCKGCGKPVASAGAAAEIAAAAPPPPAPAAPAPSPMDAARLAASEAPTLVDPVPAKISAPAPAKAVAEPLRAPGPPVSPAPAVLPPVPPRPAARKTGNHGALIAGLALVIVIALAAGYWFVLRKPPAQEAAATPTAPGTQPAETVSQAPQDAPPQPPDAAEATQPPPSTDGPADTAPPVGQPVDQSQTVTKRTVKPSAAKPSKSGYTQAHEAAQQALLAGKYFDPPESSALFWARKARALGDPAAAQIEQQIFARQMSEIASARQSHNYDQARAQIYQLASNFPDHAEVRQLQDDVHSEQLAYTQQLEDQRTKAEAATRVQKFAVQHRHGVGNNFCTGIIIVNADGSARYDCSTADGSGRCEHVTFAPGSLKEAKIRGDGSLHVATRQTGNYDFVGGSMNLKDAATALASLVGK